MLRNRIALVFLLLLVGPAHSQLLLTQAGGSTYEGPADVVGVNAVAWYGLRGYKHGYTGNAIELCNQSSACEIETIGSNGLLTLGATGQGCNNTTNVCTIETWYDQTDAGNNLTQTIASERAKLIVPGSATSPNGATQNNLFYASCGSTSVYQTTSFNGNAQILQPYSAYLFGSPSLALSGNVGGFFVANNGGDPDGPSSDGRIRWDVYAGSNPYLPASPSPAWHNLSGVFNGAVSIGGVDAAFTTINSGTDSFDARGTIYLCTDGYGDQWQGNFSEFGIWSTNLSSTQLNSLNTNVQAFYNPYAFENFGASIPWASPSRGAFLDTATNIVWLFTYGYVCATNCAVPAGAITFYSVPQVFTYNQSTGIWGNSGQPYTLGTSQPPTANDYHAAPSCVETNESGTSYWYCFYGAHNSAVAYSTFAASSLGATIISTGTFGTDVTGPLPFFYNGKIYLFYLSQGNGSNNQDALFVQIFTPSAGTLTTSGSPINIIDSATAGNTGWLAGTSSWQIGVNVYIAASYATTFNGDWTAAYLFVYNLSTGAISNFQGTNTVPSGSLPIGPVSYFNANGYEVYTGSNLGSTWQYVDSNGVDHFLIGDNSSGDGFLAYLENNGGGWSATTNLYNFTSSLGGYNAQAIARTNSTGNIDVYFSDGVANLLKTTKTSGTFGTPQTILTQQGAYPLGFPQVVINGGDNASVIFTEGNSSVVGNLRGYLFGTGGFIANPAGM